MLTPDYAKLSEWHKQVDLSEIDTQAIEVNLPDGLGQLVFKARKRISKKETPSKSADSAKANANTDSNASTNAIKTQNDIMVVTLPLATSQVQISFCHENPTVLPDFRQHKRSLKKVLQELAIAPWQRQRIPFIYHQDGNTLIAACGYFVCQEFSSCVNALEIEVVWNR